MTRYYTFLDGSTSVGSSTILGVQQNGGEYGIGISSSVKMDDLTIINSVGIGTTNPLENLHVHSFGNTDILVSSSKSDGYSEIYFRNDIGQDGWIWKNGSGRSVGAPWYEEPNGFQVYNGSNAPLDFGTNSGLKVRITGSGNVGIGTTIPVDKLEINIGTGGGGINFSGSNSRSYLGITDSDSSLYFWNEKNSYLYFGTNDLERLRITGDGNIGIGTTNPEYTLDVYGYSKFSYNYDPSDSINQSPYRGVATIVVGNNNTSANTHSSISFSANDSTNIGRHGAAISMLKDGTWTGESGSYPGHLVFWTRPSSSSDELERMRILSSGSVGIGITNPTSKLQVQGDVLISGITTFGLSSLTSPQSNSQMSFELTNNTTLKIRVKGTDGVVRTGTITLA